MLMGAPIRRRAESFFLPSSTAPEQPLPQEPRPVAWPFVPWFLQLLPPLLLLQSLLSRLSFKNSCLNSYGGLHVFAQLHRPVLSSQTET